MKTIENIIKEFKKYKYKKTTNQLFNKRLNSFEVLRDRYYIILKKKCS